MPDHVPHPEVATVDEWVHGPDDTPFFTTRWAPKNEEPKAYILFVHGFAEHITRYHAFLQRLAAPPSSIHVTAFDQRGHGRTSQAPLTESSEQVIAWKNEGKTVKLEKNAKRKTGGWARVMPDIEWFVRRESELAKSKGKKLFLHGFSMGGGQVIAFATRPRAPPSPETVKLLSGIISGGPMLRQSTPSPYLQLKAGSLAASIGLGSMLVPTPALFSALSHDEASNQKYGEDPFCEPVGTARQLSDMLNGGITLDSPAGWDAWPEDLPLLVYHGGEDAICDPKAAIRFGERVRAKDKKVEIIEGMFHEVHNELEPVPTQVANIITQWVHERCGEQSGRSSRAGTFGGQGVGGTGAGRAAVEGVPSIGSVGQSKL